MAQIEDPKDYNIRKSVRCVGRFDIDIMGEEYKSVGADLACLIHAVFLLVDTLKIRLDNIEFYE